MRAGKITVVAFVFLAVLMFAGSAFAQLYGGNVVASQSNAVTVTSSGSATVNNVASTGVSVTLTGLTGLTGTGSVVVTTTKLSAPSTNVASPPLSGVKVYDISVQLPAGYTPPPGATVQVQITDSSLSSTSILLEYTNGAWTTVPSSVSGTTITGTVSVTSLGGTNFVIGQAPADYTAYYVLAVVAIIVVAVAIVLMRRRKPAA